MVLWGDLVGLGPQGDWDGEAKVVADAGSNRWSSAPQPQLQALDSHLHHLSSPQPITCVPSPTPTRLAGPCDITATRTRTRPIEDAFESFLDIQHDGKHSLAS
jgi:hypothetical protein